MTPNAEQRERIHRLWDALADYDASQIDAALTFLLENLCLLVAAKNADWIGVVRLINDSAPDQVHGWRPGLIHFFHSTEKLLDAVKRQTRKLEHGVANEVIVRIADMAGRFRACRMQDVVPPAWFDSESYRDYYQACGHDDAVYVAFPVNADSESYFGIFRGPDQPRFSVEDRDTLAYALRGIKWFHRQLLLSHGLTIAKSPLTPVERQVLRSLLTGQAEKQIAADLGQSYHTTHDYVTAIFRKFGVNNRAALMALWLGRAP